MKFFVPLLFISITSYGQFSFPELSPESKIHQPVGYTVIDIRYGRPAARGRKIMDGLVPFKRLWRTGAGKCTTISFGSDVVINNKKIPAGTYSIATIPDSKTWTIMLNSDTSKIYGEPEEYDIKKEVIRFTTESEHTGRYYESLTIILEIINGDAVFYLAWENTQIHFQIATNSHKQALADIQNAIEAKPTDVELLNSAAWYYYMTNESSEQALQWLNKALSVKEERWTYYQKIDVLERMKNYKEARITANKAITILKRDKPDDWEDTIIHYETKIKSWPNN